MTLSLYAWRPFTRLILHFRFTTVLDSHKTGHIIKPAVLQTDRKRGHRKPVCIGGQEGTECLIARPNRLAKAPLSSSALLVRSLYRVTRLVVPASLWFLGLVRRVLEEVRVLFRLPCMLSLTPFPGKDAPVVETGYVVQLVGYITHYI